MNISRSLHDSRQLAYAALLPIFCSFIYLFPNCRPKMAEMYHKMAGYSIDDRLDVRWQTKPFYAAVINVHSPGKVDVVYDIDAAWV